MPGQALCSPLSGSGYVNLANICIKTAITTPDDEIEKRKRVFKLGGGESIKKC